jgi:hypothetical protein
VLTKHAHLELPGVISVNPGIRLLPAGYYPPAEMSAEPAVPA